MNEEWPKTGYPRMIHMGFGIIAVAKNEEHRRQLRRDNLICVLTAIPTGIAFAAAIAWYLHP